MSQWNGLISAFAYIKPWANWKSAIVLITVYNKHRAEKEWEVSAKEGTERGLLIILT